MHSARLSSEGGRHAATRTFPRRLGSRTEQSSDKTNALLALSQQFPSQKTSCGLLIQLGSVLHFFSCGHAGLGCHRGQLQSGWRAAPCEHGLTSNACGLSLTVGCGDGAAQCSPRCVTVTRLIAKSSLCLPRPFPHGRVCGKAMQAESTTAASSI